MFLALRELQHAWVRYLLFGAIITLVAWLVFLLSGLANGLSTDNAATVQKMPVDYFVLQADARTQMGRSLISGSLVETVGQVPGVTAAAPVGQMLLSIRREAGGDQLDASMLGIEPGSFIMPPIVAGRDLDPAIENGVVVDEELGDKGVVIGDTLVVQPAGQELRVIGFVRGQTLTHTPVVYATLSQWRALRFAAPGSDGGIAQPISTVVIKADQGAADRIAETIPGVEVASRGATVSKLPGYSEENSSVLMIQGFLFVIAAFILAVFFYVITLQKTAQFGILKAIGARTGFLARSLLVQVVILTVAGIVTGAALAFGAAAIIPSGVPFSLDAALVLTYGIVLLVVALLGTLLSLRQIATIDPLIAIGRID
jgi:putative ABC transport system permease protein